MHTYIRLGYARYTDTYIHIYTFIHTYTHTHIYHIYICCTHIHTHTQTHTQTSPLVYYTWDESVTANAADISKPLTATGNATSLSPGSECKYGTCIRFTNDVCMQIPLYNLAQATSGLTVSFWIKPDPGSGPDARLVVFSNVDATASVSVYRSDATGGIVFAVSRPTEGTYTYNVTDSDSSTDMWQSGTWTHISWSITATSSPPGAEATWKMYINGELVATAVDGMYPADADLDASFLGACADSTDLEGYIGYMDSFMLYGEALTDNEIRIIYLVSACLCVCVWGECESCIEHACRHLRHVHLSPQAN
jgi:hypothetical protein